jgi:hypothetical protein
MIVVLCEIDQVPDGSSAGARSSENAREKSGISMPLAPMIARQMLMVAAGAFQIQQLDVRSIDGKIEPTHAL